MIFDASEVVDLLAGLVEEKAKAEINKQKIKVDINKMTDSDSTNGWPQFDERAQVGKDKWEKGDDKSLALIAGLPRIKRSVMVHIPGMPMSDELAVLFNYPGEPKSPLCDMESTDPVIVAAHFSLVEFLTSERLRSRTEPIRDFALDQGRANFHFAASCLRYLAFVAKVYELEGLVVDSVPDRFPFTQYATLNGLWYANMSECDEWPPLLHQLVAHLLPPERGSRTFKTVMKLVEIYERPRHMMPSPNSALLYSIS